MISVMKLEDKRLCDSNFPIAVFGVGNRSLTELIVREILSGIPYECQTDRIQIRPDKLSGLIWVQSVCKGYEQTTLGDK